MGKNIGAGFLKLDDLERVTASFHEKQKKSQLTAGDIVVVRIGKSGQAAIIPENLGPANCSGLVVLKRPSKVQAKYLIHYLNSPDGRRQSLAETKGATRQTLNTKSIAEAKIPLPPTNEQLRIADILDRAAALRAKRRAAIAHLDELIQAIFIDMFGEAGSDARWKNRPLDSFVSDTRLGLVRGATELSPELPYPYIRMNAITRSGELDLSETHRAEATMDELRDYTLRSGDFLFNTRNSEELVGKTALYEATGIHLFNNNILRMRFTAEAEPVYVAAAFRTRHIRRELSMRKSGTTSVFAIYWKDLRSLPVPLPPISLQQEFTRKVARAKQLLASHRRSLSMIDDLFATLQARAFRGAL